MTDKYKKLADRYCNVIEECIEKNETIKNGLEIIEQLLSDEDNYCEEIKELKTDIISLGDLHKKQMVKIANMQKTIDLYKSHEDRLIGDVI